MSEFTSERTGGEPALPLPPVVFKLDGEEFRCMEEVTGDALLEWSELGIAASDEVDIDSPEGVAYLARFLRAAFAPAAYARFRRHVRGHETPPETVMAIVAEIQRQMAASVEALTDRPTGPSSPSSSGDEAPGGGRAAVISLDKGFIRWQDETEAAVALAAQEMAEDPQGARRAAGKRKAASGGKG